MGHTWYGYLGWIVSAGLIGFVISAVFAGTLRLPRNLYLIPYVGFTTAFLYAYVRWSGLSISNLIKHHWYWGLLGALLLALWTTKNVLSQPASQKTDGLPLLFDLLWSGVIYGLMDALFLSVLPVLATWEAFTLLNWTTNLPGKFLVGVLGIIASLVVTVAYHLGYPEYRGRALVGPSIGNSVMTLGYLLTNNPLAAILSHIAMHIAGVIHGPASVIQLPPHYQS